MASSSGRVRSDIAQGALYSLRQVIPRSKEQNASELNLDHLIHSAWTTFTWKSGSGSKRVGSEAVLAATPASTNALGRISVAINGAELDFEMWPPDKPGDGTVPEVSGAASASKAKFAAKMTGYEHQGSYQHQGVKDVTLYSVARISMELE